MLLRYKKTLPGLGRVFGDLVNALCVVSFFSNQYWPRVYYYDQELGDKNEANVGCCRTHLALLPCAI